MKGAGKAKGRSTVITGIFSDHYTIIKRIGMLIYLRPDLPFASCSVINAFLYLQCFLGCGWELNMGKRTESESRDN